MWYWLHNFIFFSSKILGANGAGKTTMINLILGKLKPWSGQLRLNEQVLFENMLCCSLFFSLCVWVCACVCVCVWYLQIFNLFSMSSLVLGAYRALHAAPHGPAGHDPDAFGVRSKDVSPRERGENQRYYICVVCMRSVCMWCICVRMLLCCLGFLGHFGFDQNLIAHKIGTLSGLEREREERTLFFSFSRAFFFFCFSIFKLLFVLRWPEVSCGLCPSELEQPPLYHHGWAHQPSRPADCRGAGHFS